MIRGSSFFLNYQIKNISIECFHQIYCIPTNFNQLLISSYRNEFFYLETSKCLKKYESYEKVSEIKTFSLISVRVIRFCGPGAKHQKWSIPRSMMSPCDKTYFSTLVTGKFGNVRIPNSIISLPSSAQEKYHVLVDAAVTSIDRTTDHFCCIEGWELKFQMGIFIFYCTFGLSIKNT